MKAFKHLPVLGIFLICALAFSADLAPRSQLYKAGKIRFEQGYVLDDEAIPEEFFFESPSTVACDPEGNIYVVDSEAKNIKKFDAEGKFLKTIGREGQGPGEFGGLYYSTFAGYRLIVWDSGNRRLCAFTPEGEFVDSASIAYDEGSVRKMRGLPTGEVLVEMEKTFRQEPDRPQTCRIDLYSPELKYMRTVYKRELWRKKYIRTKEFGISTLYFPYSPDVRWDLTPDGRIVIGFSENYELEIYDLSGKKRSAFLHAHEPVKVTEQDKEDYFDSLAFYRMGERLKETPAYIAKYTEFLKHKPVYNDILVDSSGNIWVILNRAKQDEMGRMFDVFDPKGKFISRVRIEGGVIFPDNRNAYILHNGSLLLIETDENDLYRVIQYKLAD